MSVDTLSFQEYHQHVARLRLMIEWNGSDFEVERSGSGRIVYLFDASVVQLFLNPERGLRHFDFMPGLGDLDELLATTLVTSEFLFSKKLSGQRRAPAYLTPSHAEDVANIVSKIGEKVDRMKAVAKVRTDRSVEQGLVADLISGLKAGTHSAKDIYRQLAKLTPRLVIEAFDGPAFEARQLDRLLSEDLLRPLPLLPEATTEVLRPDRRFVQRWMRYLEIEKRDAGKGGIGQSARTQVRKTRPDDREDGRTYRDAVTLAQLTLLNDLTDDVERVRYVLVTTDRAMSRAYTRWMADEGIDVREYPLRHPLQYVPILNTGQMDNDVRRFDLFEQVREATDRLFGVPSDDIVGYLDFLLSVAEPSRTKHSMLSDRSRSEAAMMTGQGMTFQSLPKLAQIWKQAADAALLLNGKVLERHLHGRLADLEHVLNVASTGHRELLSYLDGLMSEMENVHTRFMAKGFLAGGTHEGIREPIAPLIDLDRIGRQRLQNLAQTEVYSSEVWLDTRPDVRLIAETALTAADHGRWDIALQLARRASTIRRESVLEDEPPYADTLAELTYLETAFAARVPERVGNISGVWNRICVATGPKLETGMDCDVRLLQVRADLGLSWILVQQARKVRSMAKGEGGISDRENFRLFLDVVDSLKRVDRQMRSSDFSGTALLRELIEQTWIRCFALDRLLFDGIGLGNATSLGIDRSTIAGSMSRRSPFRALETRFHGWLMSSRHAKRSMRRDLAFGMSKLRDAKHTIVEGAILDLMEAAISHDRDG